MQASRSGDAAWPMLLALTSAFALSQAFRTVAAILAPPLAAEFALSARALGIFAAAFHFAFGALQFLMGVAIDLFGVRRTVLAVFPLAVVGALLSSGAQGYATLVAGQVLIGIGCSPAFLVCTVFIARRFEPQRFAAVSGMALGIGTAGLLLTGTPLAWVVDTWSWRAGFAVLAALAAAAWVLIFLAVRLQPPARAPLALHRALLDSLASYGELLRLPHTLGIVVLGLFTYASFLTIRGLWIGPLLIERHAFTLVQSGHVALAASVFGMLGPPLFGRLDPGLSRRRIWLVLLTAASAFMFALVGLDLGAAADVALLLLTSLVSGYVVLQYADTRNAYPPEMTGRAMALFTMSMFMGVGLMQWWTGAVAAAAQAAGVETYSAVLPAIAAALMGAALVFRLLPGPRAVH